MVAERVVGGDGEVVVELHVVRILRGVVGEVTRMDHEIDLARRRAGKDALKPFGRIMGKNRKQILPKVQPLSALPVKILHSDVLPYKCQTLSSTFLRM